MREHHWPVSEIDALFFDSIDYHGLVFWYNDIIAVNKELEAKTKPK